MSSLLKTISKKEAALPFIFFAIGITFFGIGVYNPVPSEVVDNNFGIGVMFFAIGIGFGLYLAIRPKRKRK